MSSSLVQRIQDGMSKWRGVLLGGMTGQALAGGQHLPVNLGEYGLNNRQGLAARMQGVDQALVWVVGALLLWGMVMV